ncbi:MAG: hypothetical protein KDA96_12680 [Planctomycetaceae bacterium]|nr:hypothetical protein [Planctomycetaceae bacterium]
MNVAVSLRTSLSACLLFAFSGAKQTMEVMKVSLDELERMKMPASVERHSRED